jgi:hypothetical protein
MESLVVIAKIENNGVRTINKRRMYVKVVVYNKLVVIIVEAAQAHGCPHVTI